MGPNLDVATKKAWTKYREKGAREKVLRAVLYYSVNTGEKFGHHAT